MAIKQTGANAAPALDDPLCPICGKRRDMLVERSTDGMDGKGAPARCVMYHPGYDTPGIRRFTPSGICWLVDEQGIRRRDFENDVVNKRLNFESR